METKELVKALLCCTGSPRIKDCKERCRYFRGGNMNKCIPDMGKDVASALESMQEELDRVKAERDAAVKDILARDHCDVCKHNHGDSDQCEANEYDCNGCKAPCMCASCRDESNWQWRGLEGRKEL